MKKSLFLLPLFAFLAFAVSYAQESEEGFQSLFNGTDLTGWHGDPRLWTVEDGMIVGHTDDGDRKIDHNNFLIYEKPVKDFVIRFDYWISKGGNSGLQYRSRELEDVSYGMAGYQADFDGAARYSGIVYGERDRGIMAQRGTKAGVKEDHQPYEIERFASDDDLKAAINIEGWNSYEVIVRGYTFEHRINGKTMSMLEDNDPEMRKAQGLLGIQCHAGLGEMVVKIKNIRMKTLDE